MLSWQVALPLAFFAPAIATFVMGRGVARSTLALQIRLLMCPPFGERNLVVHLLCFDKSPLSKATFTKGGSHGSNQVFFQSGGEIGHTGIVVEVTVLL